MMEYEMKLTAEQAKIRCDEYHPENDHSELNFTATKDKITPICPKHGKFEIVFFNYASPKRKRNCSKCANENRSLTQEQAKIRCDEAHPHNDHCDLNFTGAKNKITPICPEHGKFKTTFHSYASPSQKQGCAQCGKRKRKKQMPSEQAKIRCDEAHPENDHSELDFAGANNKITPICPEHGKFSITFHRYASPSQKQGCPDCAIGGFKSDKPSILYFFKIEGLYKVGITNSSVKLRYMASDRNQMTEIHEIQYATGQEALDAEKLIKKTYAVYQTKRTDRIFHSTGNTELFEIDLYRELYAA